MTKLQRIITLCLHLCIKNYIYVYIMLTYMCIKNYIYKELYICVYNAYICVLKISDNICKMH